jgi:hypothetical protein
MVCRQGIDTRFHVREVLAEQGSHVLEQAITIRHRSRGPSTGPRVLALLSHALRQPVHGETMPDIPSNAGELGCAISSARGEAREGSAHACCHRWTRACLEI